MIIRPRSHRNSSDRHNDVFTEKYAKKFTDLNRGKIGSGLLGLIRKIVGVLDYYIGDRKSLNWSTHMFAEHFSRGRLSGNRSSVALHKTIQLLQKMDEPQYNELAHALSYAAKVIQGKVPSKQIREDIKNLQVGQSIALQSNSLGHAMILFITRASDTTFTVVQHNQGEGVTDFHYQKIGEDGKKRFQTALVIEDVLEENLCDKKAPFIDRLLANRRRGTTNTLYNSILPLLKGKIAPPSDDKRLWGHGQIGGSCSAACLLSLIRSQLDESSYKAFRDFGRVEMLLKSYKKIKSGWGTHSTQKIVTLEVVKALEKSLKNRKIELPSELEIMKERLSASKLKKAKADFAGRNVTPSKEQNRPPPPVFSPNVPKQVPAPLEGRLQDQRKTSSIGYANDLQRAVAMLKRGDFSLDALDHAKELLLRAAYTDIKPPIPVSEVKKFIRVSLQLEGYCTKKPFTKEQLYTLTVVTSVIRNLLSKLKWQNDQKVDFAIKIDYENEMLSLFSLAHKAYNGLSLGEYFKNDAFHNLISYFQSVYFTPGLTTPEGLEELQKKMAS